MAGATTAGTVSFPQCLSVDLPPISNVLRQSELARPPGSPLSANFHAQPHLHGHYIKSSLQNLRSLRMMLFGIAQNGMSRSLIGGNGISFIRRSSRSNADGMNRLA